MTDITNHLEVIISIIAIIVGGILIPLVKAKLASVAVDKERTALDVTVQWLEIACNAAEEAARKGLIDKPAKYGYAVKLLEKQGITFDADTMQALVDAKVWELFNQFKDVEGE